MAEARLPISVCLIAANEAHRIRKSLESVASWAGEIIVLLNDDVNDGTDKIAESFGAEVFREPWKGFIAQKNSVARKASCDWIFGVDADEVVSPELQREIRELFSNSEKLKNFAAFSLPRCTQYGGRWIRHGDWYPDRNVRLWRRGSGAWSGIDPHAAVTVNGHVGKLNHDLLHYSMEDLNHLIRKTISYTDTLARQKFEAGQRVGGFTLFFRPTWRFIRGYVFRLGFLDGWQGFSIAWLGAFYTFLRYAKVRELQLSKSNE
jgi:glycosyltransferase involved in cell wall biosynthesis